MKTAYFYPIKQIAISTHNMTHVWTEGWQPLQKGDIATIWNPKGMSKGIGQKEGKRFLWLLVEGLEVDLLHRLKQLWYEPKSSMDAENACGQRRFQIPFSRLVKMLPGFDIERVEDDDDDYQPFLLLDKEVYYWLSGMPPLQAQGLIYDKAIGEYI